MSIFMKIRLVGAELPHADGRTDRLTKLIVAFRNHANAPKTQNQQNILFLGRNP